MPGGHDIVDDRDMTIGQRARRNEGIAHVRGATGRGQFALAAGVAASLQDIATQWGPAWAREPGRDPFGLVETAPTIARWMQRDGYKRVGPFERLRVQARGQKVAQQSRVVEPALEF